MRGSSEGSGEKQVQMELNAIGRWMVHEVGDEHELASFDAIEDCVEYAYGMEQRHEAVVVQEVQTLH